jgi:hypothetical protein
MPIITWPTFSRAHNAVTAELAKHGFWDERLEARLPRRLDTPGIRQQWQFIDELSEAVWAEVRQW